MKTITISLQIVSALVAVSWALPLHPDEVFTEPEEPEDGNAPHQEDSARYRRSPQFRRGSFGVDVDHIKNVGTVVSADYNRNLWKGDGRQLDGQARWSQVVRGREKGSANYGGSLTYSDRKGAVSGSIDRQRGFGTSVGVGADRNLWRSRDGRTSLDGQASWSKVIRGPARGRPNYGGFINFSRRF